MEDEQVKPHAIIIPLPHQGHINPAVNFALNLASIGFTITFVNTQEAHQRITTAHLPGSTDSSGDIFSEARKSGLDIRYATISDGFPLAFDRVANQDQYTEGLLHVFSAHVDEFVANLVREAPQPVNILIADTFYVWPSTIAKKYNLVHVTFWTEPALVFTLYYHLDLLRINGHFGTHDKRGDTIDYIPGVSAIEPRDLISFLQDDDIETVSHRYIFKSVEDAKKADFVICNTIQELESEATSALQKKKPIYAVGPIFSSGFAKSIVPINLWPKTECASWLHDKPRGSVLYVSFGSFANVPKRVILEIAGGLLISKVSFIWAIRPDILENGEGNALGVEFEDAVSDRGLVVPWCDQIEVLSHSAVGGFLSHCGWNSILESMRCSVPLLCFPILTDQFTNRKLVVDDWRIGINLCDAKEITKEEVAEKIEILMRGGLGGELRNNVMGIKNTLESAISADGSSEINLMKFISDVKVMIRQRQQEMK